MNDTEHIEGAELAADDFVDDYTTDVETAAQLLGIGTTRLSQITSRGTLSFQRRKVGFRNRMFYRKSELLAYLEKNFPASVQFKSQMLTERWAAQNAELSNTVPEVIPQQQEQLNIEPLLEAIKKQQAPRKPELVAQRAKLRPLPSALSIREKAALDAKLDAVLQGIHVFQQALTRVERKLDAIQKRERATQQPAATTKNLPSALSTSLQNKATKPARWPRVYKKNSNS
jgi:hypothetical protein